MKRSDGTPPKKRQRAGDVPKRSPRRAVCRALEFGGESAAAGGPAGSALVETSLPGLCAAARPPRELCSFGRSCYRFNNKRHFGQEAFGHADSRAHPAGTYGHGSSQVVYPGDPEWPPPMERQPTLPLDPEDREDNEGAGSTQPLDGAAGGAGDDEEEEEEEEEEEVFEWSVQVVGAGFNPGLLQSGFLSIGPLRRKPNWKDGQPVFVQMFGRANLVASSQRQWKSISSAHTQIVGKWDERRQTVTLWAQHSSARETSATLVDGVPLKSQHTLQLPEVNSGSGGGGGGSWSFTMVADTTQPDLVQYNHLPIVITATNRWIPSAAALTPSVSFDRQYQQMLRVILASSPKTSRRGEYREAPTSSQRITLDLRGSDDCPMPLPATSLRRCFQKAMRVELCWYLRGDDTVHFLHKHGIHFWDADADEDGYLGLNYGLLTNFPSGKDGVPPTNQLDEKVLRPLCAGKAASRNMVPAPFKICVKPAETSTIRIS